MESEKDRKLVPKCSKKQPQISGSLDGDTSSIDSNDRTSEPSCRQKTSFSSSEDLGLPDSKSTDPCDGCRRQRHSATSIKVSNGHPSEGVWPALTAEGNAFNHMPEVTPGASGDVTFSPGDDMENYFNANAHMLQGYDGRVEESILGYGQWYNGDAANQGLDVYETWIANDSRASGQATDEGVEMFMSEDKEFPENPPVAYLSEDYLGPGVGFSRCDSNDSLYNHCADDLYQMNVANSTEDIGDFIETDIPKNPYGCGSSDSVSSRSRTPSDDDLTTLALEPGSHSNRVTGSGDIQGALSLDWNMQFNIEHAQRPPSLLVTGRPGTLSAECNGAKPRTTSDTDYGFFTPTSCASGSSMRTRSIQSPQLSDYSATCGMNSADSSAFVSPDSDHAGTSVPGPSCVRPRDGAKRTASHNASLVCPEAGNHSTSSSACLGSQLYARPREDGPAFNAPKRGEEEIDNNNFDRLSLKSSKEKLIEVKVHNREPAGNVSSDKERRRRNKGSGTSGEASSLPGLDTQSSLNSISATTSKSSTGANRLDCIHYGHNDLNPRNHGASDSSGRASQSSDQFNVSRQTSTSDFDQDENSFQEIVDFPPGLLENSCPSCEDEDDDDDDAAFHENPERSPAHQPSVACKRQNCPDPACSGACKRRARSLADRRRAQQNLIQLARDDSQDSRDGESLDNLLQSIPVIQIPPPMDTDNTNMEDIPLPPQTPILNRQWLKKAAKYLDYNFLYKSLFKDDESESDSDSEGQFEGDLRDADFDLDLAGDASRDMTHLKGRKMLYSVLLKDALLKHLQDRSNLYNSGDSDTHDVKKVMLWSEYQAYVLQVSQIGTSACGATAVINVLKYFDLYIEQEKVCDMIPTNMRAETASIGEYLISRSVAGTTAMQLVEGIHNLTEGLIYGKFFHMFPERDVSIRTWLGEWMEKGAVPVVTLNRQRAIPQGWVVPDAWHHQMVYGVGPKGLYMTNPLEIVPEYVIQYQLSSESVLLVRRNDVVSRWHQDCNLGVLLQQDDVQWQDMNVLGQVVNVLREDRAPRMGTQCPQLTSHITVPAWYRSGVTLFVKRDSDAYLELIDMPEELPLKCAKEDGSPGTVSSTGSSLQQLFAEGGEGRVDGSNAKDSPS